MNVYHCVAPDVRLGRDIYLSKFVNLYGSRLATAPRSARS